jgi:hypothetical protein
VGFGSPPSAASNGAPSDDVPPAASGVDASGIRSAASP